MLVPKMNTSPLLDYVPSSGLPTPPSPLVRGYMLSWQSIVNLSGGNAATDLDAQEIGILPAGTSIFVFIAGRGGSLWLRVQDATSPVTDLDGGVIVPIEYDPTLNPFVLQRQLGY